MTDVLGSVLLLAHYIVHTYIFTDAFTVNIFTYLVI